MHAGFNFKPSIVQFLASHGARFAGDKPNHHPSPMTTAAQPCPQCHSEFAYQDGALWVCPECAHEWTAEDLVEAPEGLVVRDANGNPLQDGDTGTVIKDLKVKGSSLVVKVGTKVKNIRLVEGDHDIDCKIDGVGSMGLKSAFVKKA